MDAEGVAGWLENFVLTFNFTRPGLDRSLGRDVANLVAGQIGIRSATLLKGADVDWEPNERRYRERKAKAYGWEDPNYRTGQMLSHDSLRGEPIVEPITLTMVYGTGEPPDRTYSPRDARTPAERRRDESVTDRQKALWAHEGDRKRNRPARPFYQLDDAIRDAVVELVDEALADYLTKGA